MDRTADVLRETMARLRDRVAATRAEEPASEPVADESAAFSPAADAGQAASAGDRGVIHLLPPAEPGQVRSPAASSGPDGDKRQGIDPTIAQLAHDLLALAYRSACQSVYACAVENEQRLRAAQDAAQRIRAAANEAAEATVRQAEDENVHRLKDVQRRSEALVRVVQAQLRAVGLREPLELPLLDGPSLPDRLPALTAARPVAHPPAAWADLGVGRDLGAGMALPRSAPYPSEPPSAAPTGQDTWMPSDEPADGAAELLPLGSVELSAGPFRRFSQLAAFTQALNSLPGVQSVATRQFYRGRVHFRIRYDGPVPFATAIGDLSAFHPAIVVDTPNRVEVRVAMDPPADESTSQAGA
jgi:hypothetical protein